MMYWVANEAMPIAEDLIRQHHTHLASAKIGYLFREKAAKRGGKVVLGTASKFPSKYQAFFDQAKAGMTTDPDHEDYIFLIELAWDQWQLLPDVKRRALLDHELSHCWGEEAEEAEKAPDPVDGQKQTVEGKGGEMKWSILYHDFEEFGDVIRRNGLWRDELVDAKRIFANAT